MNSSECNTSINISHRIKIFLVSISLILLQIFSLEIAYADNKTKDPYKLGGFISSGMYKDTETVGLGFSFGLTLKEQSSIFTLKNTVYIDLFGNLAHSNCTTEAENSLINCDNDDPASISEVALLYGKKWKSLWFSGGVGRIKGENIGGLFEKDRKSFTTTGFAYSLLWEKPIKWLGIDYELSGNINSVNNYMFISGRLSF